MRRFEVAVRSSTPVTVPDRVCCACGRGPGDGVRMSARRHKPFWHTGVETLMACEFPLCAACARSLRTRSVFPWTGAAAAFVPLAAVWTVSTWESGVSSMSGAVVDLIFLCGLAPAIGAAAGRLAENLVALVWPGVWMGSHAAHSVDFEFERSRRGMHAGEHRGFFRFSSEEYARAFAAANTSILISPGDGTLPAPAEAEASR